MKIKTYIFDRDEKTAYVIRWIRIQPRLSIRYCRLNRFLTSVIYISRNSVVTIKTLYQVPKRWCAPTKKYHENLIPLISIISRNWRREACMNPFKSKNMEATHETHSRSHMHILLNVYLASIQNAFPTYTSRHAFGKFVNFHRKTYQQRERLHISRMK